MQPARSLGAISGAFGSLAAWFRSAARRLFPATRSTPRPPAIPGNRYRVAGPVPPLTRPLGHKARLIRVGSSTYFRDRRGCLWRVMGGTVGIGHNVVLVGRRRERVAELDSGRVMQ